MTPAPLTNFFFAFIVLLGLFFLPGILSTCLIFTNRQMDWLERIPIGAGLSLGFLLIPILLTRIVRWNWDQFLWIWILLVLTSFSVMLLSRHWRLHHLLHLPRAFQFLSSTHSGNDGEVTALRLDAPRFIMVLFGMFLTLTSALTLFTPRDEDDWIYFAWVRDLSDLTRFSAFSLTDRYHNNPWWFLHALIVRVSSIDVVHLGQDLMPFVFVPVAFLAFYALARALFHDQKMAIIAVVIQFIFLVTDFFNPDESVPWPGWWLFARLDQDHTIVIFVWVTVFAALLVRYFQEGELKWLLAALIIQVGAISVHGTMGLTLSVLIAIWFVGFHLIFIRHNWEVKCVLWLVILEGALCLLLSPAFPNFKTEYALPSSFVTSTDTEFPFSRWQYTFFSSTIYTLRLDFLGQPPVLAAILLMPFFLPFLRQSITARFLLGNTIGLLAIFYIPPLFQFLTEPGLGGTITRLWSWIPKSLVVVFFLPYFFQLFSQAWDSLRQHTWNRQLITASIALSIVLVLFAIWPTFLRKDFPIALKLGPRLPNGSYNLLQALREKAFPSGGVVLAGRDITDAIPAYGATLKPVLFRENPKSIERKDADIFYGSIFLTSKHLEILDKYNVKYVVISGNQEIVSQFDLMPNYFQPLYRGQYGVLYEVYLSSPDPLIEANTIAAYGDWDEAIKNYNNVIAAKPDDSLAHVGLGIILELLGKPRIAAQEFEEALRFVPTNVQAHYHLVRIYRSLGMLEKAEAHIQAAGRLMENAP